MAALLLLCSGFASCSQDDIPEQGEPLPYGKYPLELTATVGAPQTRAGAGDGKDEWEGGEEFAVNIGDDTRKYIIGTDGYVTASGTPYYWKSTAQATVSAWYPYATEAKSYDISDQSQGFAGFDFLYAEAQGDYTQPVTLEFSHQMAKVSYVLNKSEGITDEELASAIASLKLLGDKTVTVSGGKISAADSQSDEITPGCYSTYNTGYALMVPQNMDGKPFIKVSFDGNVFTYTPANGAGNLQAGHSYSYVITLTAKGIEVTSVTSSAWAGSGSEDVTNRPVKTYTASVLKPGDYYYDDGTWSDGGLRKLYLDDNSAKFADPMPAPVTGKSLIGIVFYVGHHPNDQSDYSSTGIGRSKCHGYVVACANAGMHDWGLRSDVITANWGNSNWNGYEQTQQIITAAGGDLSKYPATYAIVEEYKSSHPAPDKSSGWFFPSCAQVLTVIETRALWYTNKNTYGVDWLSGEIWSSSNHSTSFVWMVGASNSGTRTEYTLKSKTIHVRAILAF